jgi:hypothetical protein
MGHMHVLAVLALETATEQTKGTAILEATSEAS